MSGIARYYDESHNPEGAMLAGVPLGDVTEGQFEALPKWLQESLDAQPFYRKTRPAGAKADKAVKPTETVVAVEPVSAPVQPRASIHNDVVVSKEKPVATGVEG